MGCQYKCNDIEELNAAVKTKCNSYDMIQYYDADEDKVFYLNKNNGQWTEEDDEHNDC